MAGQSPGSVVQSTFEHMQYYVGIDVGSVSVKLCLIDENGNTVRQDVERVSTGPRSAVQALMSRLLEETPQDVISAVGLSGSASSAIPAEL